MDVIILAGGLGTRLRSVVEDVPKCMAPVAGVPFLEHLMNYLETQFVDHVVLSLGYKHEVVIDWLKGKAFTFKVSWVIEQQPLGTGGGIQLARKKIRSNEFFILNGDTYFPVDLQSLKNAAQDDTSIVLGLKEMNHFDRYGTVSIDKDNNILAFMEKKPMDAGIINGGIYYVNAARIDLDSLTPPFSFEKEILEKVGHKKGNVQDVDFIDIGIPEDYEKAQSILS